MVGACLCISYVAPPLAHPSSRAPGVGSTYGASDDEGASVAGSELSSLGGACEHAHGAPGDDEPFLEGVEDEPLGLVCHPSIK